MAQKIEGVDDLKLAQALIQRVNRYCDAQAYLTDDYPQIKNGFDNAAKIGKVFGNEHDKIMKDIVDAHGILDSYNIPPVKITNKTQRFLQAAIGLSVATAIVVAFNAVSSELEDHQDLDGAQPTTIVSPE